MGKQTPTNKPITARVAATVLAALMAVAILAGCGSSTSTTTITQASTPPATTPTTATTPASSTTTTSSTPATQTTPAGKPERVAPTGQIEIASPAINSSGELLSRYTCNGQDTPPPLEWKGVPPHTAELMIDIMQTKNDANGKIQFIWAATHIPPTTHKILDGKLPPGAVTATNSNGNTTYHLCPPKGTPETYVTVIFALPHKLPAQQGFNPKTLRHQAEHQATHQNLLFFHYTQH